MESADGSVEYWFSLLVLSLIELDAGIETFQN